MKIKAGVSFFIAAFSLSSFAGIFTNGGGKVSDQDNVWFLGRAPVEYCIELEPSMAARKSDMQALVTESLSDWKAFFRKYGLDQMSFTNISGHPAPLGLDLNFQEVATCSRPKEQIRILIGVKNIDVTKVLEYEPNFDAFASRGDYRYGTYRNGGIIYLGRTDLDRTRLKHLLLHELGHVFGMLHDSVPVMIANPGDILNHGDRFSAFFAKIETPAWQYRYDQAETIDLTADENSFLKGMPNGSISSMLPKFAPAGSHHLELAYLDALELPVERRVRLSFTEIGSSNRADFAGTFQVRGEPTGRDGVQGPSLFTTWDCGNCYGGTVKTRRLLDQRPSLTEADGFFEFNNQIYPALIEARPSLNLRIFIPTEKQWWTTEQYSTTAFWIYSWKRGNR